MKTVYYVSFGGLLGSRHLTEATRLGNCLWELTIKGFRSEEVEEARDESTAAEDHHHDPRLRFGLKKS